MTAYVQTSLLAEGERPEGVMVLTTAGDTVAPWEVGDNASPPKPGTSITRRGLTRKTAGQARARKNRAARFAIRTVAQDLSADKALRGCGRHMTAEEVEVRQAPAPTVGQQKQAYYTGLMTCGKLWLCPVCAAKIRMRRSVDIEMAVAQHLLKGGGIEFVTFTLRHKRSQRLDVLYPAVAGGWRKMWSGSPGQRLKADFEVVGFIRANEITFGTSAGWHPHIHVLVFTKRPMTKTRRAAFKARLHAKWSPWMFDATGLAPSFERGVTIKPVLTVNGDVMAKYMVKVQGSEGKATSVGLEMARADLKRDTRKDNKTPFQMLEEIVEHDSHGEVCRCRMYRAAWGEYEAATKGRRCIEWSKGLREMFDLEPEETDEDAAAQAVDAVDEVLASMDFAEWFVVRGTKSQAVLLEIAEDNGAEAARGFIDDLLSDHPEMYGRGLLIMDRNWGFAPVE